MGLDIRTNQKVNQTVVAAADGYIAFVGIEPLSWGRWVIINHPNGLSTLYGHLNDFKPDLEAYVTAYQYNHESWETHLQIPAGKFPVKKGEFIAYSGTTGGSQGPHLHWEILDSRSERRLNPSLFVHEITDNISPVVVKLAMYDRSNSTYDQTPTTFRLTKSNGVYSVSGGEIVTNLQQLSFAVQSYDMRNGTTNPDGVYGMRLFFDDTEISSFYIDSIGYDVTRYFNSNVDYKMKADGGSWMQHISKLPGDRSGIYYDLGNRAVINLRDTDAHDVRIIVSDANENTSVVNFKIRNTGAPPPIQRSYEWQPNRLNRLFRYDFEVYLPMNALYDKMNTSYTQAQSSDINSVSAKHTIGKTNLPVHSIFEIRIKPNKAISFEDRNKVVIKRTAKNTSIAKATWIDDWMTAQFRDFGTFEAFIDREPPSINSIGSGDVVNLGTSKRIVFTPHDNFGIADFRAEVDGKWLRFTNDKGHSWIYYFDDHVAQGEHTLTVTITDIAGNKTTRSWKFRR